MKPFHFRQFDVFDHLSSMKIGTDGVTLGAFSSRKDFSYALDVGTGCGVIALMLAQQSTGNITAIDIDEASAAQASANFRMSPWGNRLTSQCTSLESFFQNAKERFDLIVTNPPYFKNDLPSPNDRRNKARHQINISMHSLVISAKKLLQPGGRFEIILPYQPSIEFERIMHMEGFGLREEIELISVKGLEPFRKIMSFTDINRPLNKITSTLVIRKSASNHTDEYKAFMNAYMTSLK